MRLGRLHAVHCTAAAKRRGAGRPKDGPPPSPPEAGPPTPKTISPSKASPQPVVVISSREPAKPLIRSSFRAKRATEEEWKERQLQLKKEEEERQRKAARAADPTPSSQPPTLLIDAYNIMNLDPTIKSFMNVTDNLDFARAELERRVQVYARASGTWCVVVYDALGRWESYKGRDSGEETTKREVDERVSVVFCCTMEADSYIINTAQQLKREGCSRVEVVSNDRRVQSESRDPADYVIASVDALRFVQDLEDCGKGNTVGVVSRVFVPSDEASAQYVQMRAEAAAASREMEAKRLQLPAVDSPDIELRLVEELGSSCLDGCKEDSEDEVDTAALSADLNDLFSAPKPRPPRRPRH